MNNINVDISGFDLLLCVSLFGGFWKDEWFPLLVLICLCLLGLGIPKD